MAGKVTGCVPRFFPCELARPVFNGDCIKLLALSRPMPPPEVGEVCCTICPLLPTELLPVLGMLDLAVLGMPVLGMPILGMLDLPVLGMLDLPVLGMPVLGMLDLPVLGMLDLAVLGMLEPPPPAAAWDGRRLPPPLEPGSGVAALG